MKSTDNRYRPPRIQFNIDNWARKKPARPKEAGYDAPAMRFAKKKKVKPKP
jgi:hypothetical protein